MPQPLNHASSSHASGKASPPALTGAAAASPGKVVKATQESDTAAAFNQVLDQAKSAKASRRPVGDAAVGASIAPGPQRVGLARARPSTGTGEGLQPAGDKRATLRKRATTEPDTVDQGTDQSALTPLPLPLAAVPAPGSGSSLRASFADAGLADPQPALQVAEHDAIAVHAELEDASATDGSTDRAAGADRSDEGSGEPCAAVAAATVPHLEAALSAAVPGEAHLSGVAAGMPAATNTATLPGAKTAPHESAGPPVITQIAPVLVGIAAGPGTQRIIVQLSPEELGRLQISVSKSAEGAATISVVAERRATLALVQADTAHLHAALDQAGISAHGRTLEFHLAEPQATGRTEPAAIWTADGAAPPAPETQRVHAPAADLEAGFDANGRNPSSGPMLMDGGSAGSDRRSQPQTVTRPGFDTDPGLFVDAMQPGLQPWRAGGLRAIDITA